MILYLRRRGNNYVNSKKKQKLNKIDRRLFINKSAKVAAGAIIVPTIIPACALGKNGHKAPSDRINLAFIGAGNMGCLDVKKFLKDNRVQVTAACDVNSQSEYQGGRLGGRDYMKWMVDKEYSEKTGKNYNSCVAYTDFRDVLLKKDIDAVEVITPDHWHSIPVLMAAAAGMDIFCQKPLSLTIPEGRAMSNAVDRYNVVFQTGSQRRSSDHFRKMCEIVRNGRIGKLETVKVGLPSGTPDYAKTAHLTTPAAVPEGFDYETWLGPAPEESYCPARTLVNYRWILDYSGGQLTDWGGHFIDVAQWGMGTDDTGPARVQNARAKWSAHPVYDTAIEFYFECIYENGVKLIVSTDEGFGIKFEGSEGSIWRDSANPESLHDTVIAPDEIQLYRSNGGHHKNFINCVLSRKETAAPAEVGHRSISIAHIGNIAMKLGRDLDWDPVKEKFINDDEANEMLSREMREPWASIYKKYVI